MLVLVYEIIFLLHLVVPPEKLCNISNETLNTTTFTSSITLQWNNISSFLKQPYSIYVDDLFVASEDNTSYTLTNLNANTTYEIKICSQNISCICTTRTTAKIDGKKVTDSKSLI